VFEQRAERHRGTTGRPEIHPRKAHIKSGQLGNQYKNPNNLSPRPLKHKGKSQNLQRSQVKRTPAAPLSIQAEGRNKLQCQNVPRNFKGLRNIRQVLSQYCKQNRYSLKKYLKDIRRCESPAN
jgi:hypothetical protein